MTTRHAACSCGQLHLAIEGEPARISVCHCLACRRRIRQPGALPARAGHLHRQGHDVESDRRKRERGDLSLLSDMRLHGLLGERKLSRIPHCCHRKLSPTRISPRRPSRCGRGHATPGSHCRPTLRPGEWRSRGDNHLGFVLGPIREARDGRLQLEATRPVPCGHQARFTFPVWSICGCFSIFRIDPM